MLAYIIYSTLYVPKLSSLHALQSVVQCKADVLFLICLHIAHPLCLEPNYLQLLCIALFRLQP